MSYQYDIFISYRRKAIPKRWLEEMFLPLFTDYLEESLGGGTLKIFRDEKAIESGDHWKNKIKNALATSKCIVPILLPSYFHSEWCLKELAIIHNRQIKLGYNTLKNPSGLIIPLKIRDGDFFPKEIKDLQIFDCNDFYRVGKGVENTELYLNFQNKLIVWIEEVAKAVKNAPEWNKDWLNEDWLDISTDKFAINQDFKMKQPEL